MLHAYGGELHGSIYISPVEAPSYVRCAAARVILLLPEVSVRNRFTIDELNNADFSERG
jgi:hypothetical protein